MPIRFQYLKSIAWLALCIIYLGFWFSFVVYCHRTFNPLENQNQSAFLLNDLSYFRIEFMFSLSHKHTLLWVFVLLPLLSHRRTVNAVYLKLSTHDSEFR